MSIPKIIHYCWFGGKPIPDELKECMDTWSKLSGYEVMCWSEDNCSFDENDFVKKTYEEKKWGFIGDYYRLKAVYEYGGIYLDTDVVINKSFDKLLSHKMFINFIFDDAVGTAIIGAEKGHPVIKELMDLYDRTIFRNNEDNRVFNDENGKLYVKGCPTSNYYHTYYYLKNYDKFILNNKFQDFGEFVIYPKEMFEIGNLWNSHYAIHVCTGAWKIKADASKTIKGRLKNLLKKNEWLYRKIQVFIRMIRYNKAKKGIPFYEYSQAQKYGRELPLL